MMSDCISEIKLMLLEKQTEIIKLQQDIIDDLFLTVSLHLTAEEITELPVMDKFKQVAELMKDEQLGGDSDG
jgi:hypothetical protein